MTVYLRILAKRWCFKKLESFQSSWIRTVEWRQNANINNPSMKLTQNTVPALYQCVLHNDAHSKKFFE
jgi:hypothetical protein